MSETLVNREGYRFADDVDPKTKRPRHLHTLNGKPLTGTSEVLKVLSKPLTWWAVGEALKLLGWTPITEYINGKPRAISKQSRMGTARDWLERTWPNVGQNEETWLDALDEAYRAHDNKKNTAAKGGKDLHSKLEKYVKFSIQKNEGSPANIKDTDIQEFIDWACENVDRFLWSELHTYSEKHWLGGISDCGAKLTNGTVAIIDFKSSKAAYTDQFYQIGGYSIQLAENGGFTSKGERVIEPINVSTFIIIPFGAPTFSPKIIHDDKSIVREAYLAALTIHRANQKLE